MNIKSILILAGCLNASAFLFAAEKPPEPVEYITALAKERRVSVFDGILLKGTDRLSTPASFKPPVEITIVAKTDSTDIRLAYAADQIIFRWKLDHGHLRVDGGPASGRHKVAAGQLPPKKFVTFRWVVLPTKQSLYVDNELRYEHTGDYSGIDKPVTIFPGEGSRVTVKSIKVLQLPPETR